MVPISKYFLEVEWWATAAQSTLFQEGYAVTQHFSLIQVVRRQNDCSGLKMETTTTEKWKMRRKLLRYMKLALVKPEIYEESQIS